MRPASIFLIIQLSNSRVKDGIEHGDVEQTIANFTKAVERFANMK